MMSMIIHARPAESKVTDDLIRECRERFPSGEAEEILSFLRAHQIHQSDSITMLTVLMGITRREGKSILMRSATWSDMRAATEALHDAAEQAARELALERTDAHVSVARDAS